MAAIPFELPLRVVETPIRHRAARYSLVDKTGYCVAESLTKAEAEYIAACVNAHAAPKTVTAQDAAAEGFGFAFGVDRLMIATTKG